MFGRRKKARQAEKSTPATISEALQEEGESLVGSEAHDEAQDAVAETGDETPREVSDRSVSASGPFDISEIESKKGYIDFGAVLVPMGKDQKVRLDIDQKTKRVVALTISVGQASIQIQPFSARKSGGTWDEVRDQIQDSVVKQKGKVKQVDGAFGTELAARVPTTLKDGRSGWRVARFIGYEGSRWFLRGVVGGRGAIDSVAAQGVEDLFSRLVVVRGDDPLPPRELLPLRPPEGSKRVVTPRNPAQRRSTAPGPSPSAAAVEHSAEASGPVQSTANGVRPEQGGSTPPDDADEPSGAAPR